MKLDFFHEKISNNPRPMVVDFWAPWCGPCRAMDPILTEVSKKYVGQVDLWKINADESPDVLKSLGIMGIPTTIGYVAGKEVFRKTGLQPKITIEKLFLNMAEGKTDIEVGMPMFGRISRLVIGGGLIAFGALRGPSYILIVVGVIVMFSAVYDRCPIYKAVTAKLKSMFSKTNESSN